LNLYPGWSGGSGGQGREEEEQRSNFSRHVLWRDSSRDITPD
jgi:hypothetical protein